MRKTFAMAALCLFFLTACGSVGKLDPEAQITAIIQKLPPETVAKLLPKIAPKTMEQVCKVYNVIHPMYDWLKASAIIHEQKIKDQLGQDFDVRKAFEDYEKVRPQIVKALDSICAPKDEANAHVIEAQRQGVNWDKVGDIVLTISKIGLALL